jgi:transcriptional regulator with XRE-family HTH domain
MTQEIANHLRDLRVQSGWTQADLAEAMSRLGFDWKRITVAEAERTQNTRRVSLEEMLALAALFGVPMIELLLPSSGSVVELSDELDAPAEQLRALMLGAGGQPGSGGAGWSPAARLTARYGRRPASDLWRARRVGDRG